MRHEVRRGRKFIEYHDPDTQDEHTFTQEISGADVSYQDEAGCWRQLVEDWEVDGADGFSFRASRMNHKVRFDSIGAWRWYPRRNVETEYLVINRPQCWLTATKRWGNLLVNGISREGKDITLTSLRNVTRVIHSRWNGIKTDWILENANAPTRFRQKIDLVGITEIAGVLYGADGERLGQLMPTTATDAEGNELPCTGSYVNGYVEFSADVTGAVYPVTIDPDFLGSTTCFRVYGISNDYATARSTSNTLVDYSAKSYMVGAVGQYVATAYEVNRSFWKFDTSSIANGSTVTDVTFSAALQANYASDAYDVQVVMQDWSGQDPITNDNRETAYDNCLAGTSAGVWINTGTSKTRRTKYTSGSLNTALVTVAGTTYLSLRSSLDYAGTAPTANNNINIFTASEASYPKPTLTVTYTEAASGSLLRVNMSGNMQALNGGMN